MDRIRPWLFIGKYRHTLVRCLLQAYNIQAMLQFAERFKYPAMITLFLPVEDFEPILPKFLRHGVDFLREQKRNNHMTLVACGAGLNRSTAFCIAVLKEKRV